MNNAQEQEDHQLPKVEGSEEQVKNDVQHPQINESQQMTGGSTGTGDNSRDISIQPSDDLDEEAEKGHS